MNIIDLPEELISPIVENLDHIDRCCFAETCSRFFHIFDHIRSFHIIYLNDEEMKNEKKDPRNRYIKHDILLRYTCLTHLKISSFEVPSVSRMNHLTNLRIFEWVQVIPNSIKENSSLGPNSMKEYDALGKFLLTQPLTRLEIPTLDDFSYQMKKSLVSIPTLEIISSLIPREIIKFVNPKVEILNIAPGGKRRFDLSELSRFPPGKYIQFFDDCPLSETKIETLNKIKCLAGSLFKLDPNFCKYFHNVGYTHLIFSYGTKDTENITYEQYKKGGYIDAIITHPKLKVLRLCQNSTNRYIDSSVLQDFISTSFTIHFNVYLSSDRDNPVFELTGSASEILNKIEKSYPSHIF